MSLCTYREPKPRRWECEYSDMCDARGTQTVEIDGALTMRCDAHAPKAFWTRARRKRVGQVVICLGVLWGLLFWSAVVWLAFKLMEG